MITTWIALFITAAVMFSVALDLTLWAQRLPRGPGCGPAHNPQRGADCGFPT